MSVTKGKKGGHPEEEDRGSFWRGTAIDMDTRLRVGRAIGKTEEEVAEQIMAQLRTRGHSDAPPAITTDGNGSYREAMLETWGQVPKDSGRGRPPTRKQPQPGWQYLQVVKHRSGSRVTRVSIHVVYGNPEEVLSLLGQHTAYVERTHLTSRQMNGRLVRKTLSYSKQSGHVESGLGLGRLGLQPNPSGQNPAGGSQ